MADWDLAAMHRQRLQGPRLERSLTLNFVSLPFQFLFGLGISAWVLKEIVFSDGGLGNGQFPPHLLLVDAAIL